MANAGITLNGGFLARAYTFLITLGILIGYVAGKPLGITGGTWLLSRVSRGRLRPPVGWAAVAGVGTIAGIGPDFALIDVQMPVLDGIEATPVPSDQPTWRY